MRSFHAGLRASGKSSTATTRPTRMSTRAKSSQLISAKAGSALRRVLVRAGRAVGGRRLLRRVLLGLLLAGLLLVALLLLGRRLLLLVLRGWDRLDRLLGPDGLALAAVLGGQDGGVGLLLRGRRGRRRGLRRGRRLLRARRPRRGLVVLLGRLLLVGVLGAVGGRRVRGRGRLRRGGDLLDRRRRRGGGRRRRGRGGD